MTDAGQLARHLLWATETVVAHDQAFNVVNGDVFRWQWMWARIAEWFGLDAVPLMGRFGRWQSRWSAMPQHGV